MTDAESLIDLLIYGYAAAIIVWMWFVIQSLTRKDPTP